MHDTTPRDPLPPLLTSVWVDERGWICASFEDGTRRALDPSGLFCLPIFAPLAERQRLAEVEVIDEGMAVGWPNGADLYRGTLYHRGVPLGETTAEPAHVGS